MRPLISESSPDDDAARLSVDATFNLFNQHRNNRVGLWLAEGEDDEKIRRLLFYPWIANISDDEQSDYEAFRCQRQREIENGE
jgi:hypothetical protein